MSKATENDTKRSVYKKNDPNNTQSGKRTNILLTSGGISVSMLTTFVSNQISPEKKTI